MAQGQGFASMTAERRAEIAKMGGQAAHQQGTAHKWNSAEARAAGRKGGLNRAARRREAAGPPLTDAEARSLVQRAFETMTR